MEGMHSRSGDVQAGRLRKPSWLVFKKRGSSFGLTPRRSRRGEERRGSGGPDAPSGALSLDLGAIGNPEGPKPSLRLPRPVARRGESARELSVPQRMITTSQPESRSFTSARNGWMYNRMSRLFARWGAENTPVVPLAPRFSTKTYIPNKEAYFDDETGIITCCSPSPCPDHVPDGDAANLGAYLCKQCRMAAESESVRVDMRVDAGGLVHVQVQAVQPRCWDSDKLLQRDFSGQLLGAMSGGKKKPTSPGWGCITQFFTVCRQPQILV